jgi:recombination protein RecR
MPPVARKAAFPEPTGLPPYVARLAAIISRLPGVGFKAGEKHAVWLATHPRGMVLELAEALAELPNIVRACVQCHNLTERDPKIPESHTGILCSICTDPKRDPKAICVVATISNLLNFEKAGAWRGRYFVLGNLLSPLAGIGAKELPIQGLIDLLSPGMEVVLAFPDSLDGTATALLLTQELAASSVKITQIASGVSHGADIDFTNPVTLGKALTRRVDVESLS